MKVVARCAPVRRGQQREARTQEAQWLTLQAHCVLGMVIGVPVVVQQDVGVKRSVGRVVDDQQAAAQRFPHRVVPMRVEGVVIDDHPVG